MTPIEQIGKDKLVETIARNMRVTSDYFDDLCQEVYFILLTGYTEEKLQEAIDRNINTNIATPTPIIKILFHITSFLYFSNSSSLINRFM